jgi:hypothetical protein
MYSPPFTFASLFELLWVFLYRLAVAGDRFAPCEHPLPRWRHALPLSLGAEGAPPRSITYSYHLSSCSKACQGQSMTGKYISPSATKCHKERMSPAQRPAHSPCPLHSRFAHEQLLGDSLATTTGEFASRRRVFLGETGSGTAAVDRRCAYFETPWLVLCMCSPPFTFAFLFELLWVFLSQQDLAARDRAPGPCLAHIY